MAVRRSKHGSVSESAIVKRPLLVVDGDSFAHRAYHGLPKTILRRDGKPAGAIVGFANFLLRIYENEQPRAVAVGWDTLDVPTYRHKAFPGYQGGRRFDDALLDQLELLPGLVSACGFTNGKAPGFEADDFLAAAVAAEERRGGTAVVASGDRDTFQLASQSTTIVQPVRAGETARIGPAEVRARYGIEPAQVPDFIALRGDPSDKLPGAKGIGPKGAAALLVRLARWRTRSGRGVLHLRRMICGSIAGLRPWTRRHRFPPYMTRARLGPKQPISRANGSSTGWQTGSMTSRAPRR